MNISIENFRKHFALSEVVSPAVAAKRGDKAWAIFDTRLLDVMVWIREALGRPISINYAGMTQRGFRENTCQIVADKTNVRQLYVSAHTIGKGFDFIVKDMQAEDTRKWIRQHINECPWPIRLEKKKGAPTWVHIDTMNVGDAMLEEFDG